MPSILALHAIVALALPSGSDTLFAVARGARLDLDAGLNQSRVDIRAWDRDEVQIVTSAQFRVTTEGALVRVRPAQPFGGPNSSYTVSVPAWLPITVSAMQASISVEGVASELALTTVRGQVSVRGGQGRITVRSVEGAVSVDDARGEIEASSVNANVRVSGVTGRIHAESVNGSVTVERSLTTELFASAINGNVDFGGPMEAGGRYRVSSHNGRVRLAVQEGASATINIQTYNGEFRADFPVQLTGMGPERRFTLVLGSGSASVEASSFNGNVELRRPVPER